MKNLNFLEFLELIINYDTNNLEIVIEFQRDIEDVNKFIYPTNKWETNAFSFGKAIEDLRKNTQL